jgi:c-di-GMP-related signal transduction protein
LLAEKVETPEGHDAAMGAGFELFQGYHFAAGADASSRDALLRLLVLLSDEPEIVELEAELKRTEPRHSMFRLLNSSAFGWPERSRHRAKRSC